MELLNQVIEAVAPAITLVHCCAARPPIEVFTKAGAGGVAIDVAVLTEAAWEQIALAVEAGTTLYAGVVPTMGPIPNQEQAAMSLVRQWRQLGLDPERLKQVVITPGCGLAGAVSANDARARLELLPKTADVVGEKAEE